MTTTSEPLGPVFLGTRILWYARTPRPAPVGVRYASMSSTPKSADSSAAPASLCPAALVRLPRGPLVALAFALVAVGVAVQDAHACSFADEPPTVVWPSEGEEVPPHARLLVIPSPESWRARFTLHDDTRGMVVETSTTEYALSTFQPLVIIVPDAPLEPEHEYRITYQSTPVLDGSPIDIRRFRTLAASPEPRAFLPPPSLRWFHAVTERELRSSCGHFGHQLDVTLTAPTILPPSWWVTGRVVSAERHTIEFGAVSAGHAAMHASVALPADDSPVCLEAAIVDDRGRVGPWVRDCEADKCILLTSDEWTAPDWSTVPEGCHARCELAGDLQVCRCDPGYEGTAMLCTPIGTSTQASTPPEFFEAEPGCGCASTTARSSRAQTLVLALVVLAVARGAQRRRASTARTPRRPYAAFRRSSSSRASAM